MFDSVPIPIPTQIQRIKYQQTIQASKTIKQIKTIKAINKIKSDSKTPVIQQLTKQITFLLPMRNSYSNLKIYYNKISKQMKSLVSQLKYAEASQQQQFVNPSKFNINTNVNVSENNSIMRQKAKLQDYQNTIKMLITHLNQHKALLQSSQKQYEKLGNIKKQLSRSYGQQLQRLTINKEKQNERKSVEDNIIKEMTTQQKQKYKCEGRLQIFAQNIHENQMKIQYQKSVINQLINKNEHITHSLQQTDLVVEKILHQLKQLDKTIKQSSKLQELQKLQIMANKQRLEQKQKSLRKLLQKKKIKNVQIQNQNMKYKNLLQKQRQISLQLNQKNMLLKDLKNQIIGQDDSKAQYKKNIHKDFSFLTYLKQYQKQLKTSNILLYASLKQNCEQDQLIVTKNMQTHMYKKKEQHEYALCSKNKNKNNMPNHIYESHLHLQPKNNEMNKIREINLANFGNTYKCEYE